MKMNTNDILSPGFSINSHEHGHTLLDILDRELLELLVLYDKTMNRTEYQAVMMLCEENMKKSSIVRQLLH